MMSAGQRISMQFVGGQLALRTTDTVKPHRFVSPLPMAQQFTGVSPSAKVLPEAGLHPAERLVGLQRLLAESVKVTGTPLEQVDLTIFPGQVISMQFVTVAPWAFGGPSIHVITSRPKSAGKSHAGGASRFID